MTIIDKTDNKLTIPVGIGVVQTETTRNFYNTSDATATANDILVNKTAYGKYGKITGTLDLYAEKEISYQDGYDEGVVAGYDSGVEIGKGVGREEIISEQSDANITPDDVISGKIGYGKNNEKIVGTVIPLSNIDVFGNGIVFHNWTMDILPPYYDFSNVTNLDNMFNNCPNFERMQGVLDAISVENFGKIFVDCPNISDISIYNISKSINLAQYGLLSTNSIHFILDGLLPVEDSPIISLGSNIKKATDEDLAQLESNAIWSSLPAVKEGKVVESEPITDEESTDDDVGLLDDLKSDTMVGDASSIKKIIEEEKEKLYKYVGYNGTITSSVLLPDIANIPYVRMCADPGHVLRKGNIEYRSVTVPEFEADLWVEVRV